MLKRRMLPFVRIWLPVLVTLAGIVVMVAGGFDDIALEGGAGIVGAGLSIWLMNVLFRVGLGNDRDRDAEDAARDFFDRHGHWPDEPAPPPRGPREPVAGAAVVRTPGEPRRVPRDRVRRPPRRPG